MQKLTVDIVRILRRHKADNDWIPYTALAEWVAEEYGVMVSRETVRLAILGINWSDVQDVAAHAASYGHQGG